jgi:hypothetical protein
MDMAVQSSLSDLEKRRLSVTEQYGSPDLFVSSENDTQYYHWVEDIYLKPLYFDLRNGIFHNILWAKSPGVLGRHRHRGIVTAMTLEGTWRYDEYDWVAKPGDFVKEHPGVIHTLYSDTGCKVNFGLHSSLEFYDEKDEVTDIMDVFSFLDLYIEHCKTHGIKINEDLIGR